MTETEKGVWSFDPDTGEFVLEEGLATALMEVKQAAALAFNDTMYEALAARTPYAYEDLEEEWTRRVMETDISPIDRTNEFIIEALTGEL